MSGSWEELDESQRRSLVYQLRNRRPDVPGHWSPGPVMGVGGQGVAMVYNKLDANHHIVDHVVLKLIQLDRKGYRKAGNYYDDRDDRDVVSTDPNGHLVPNEAFCQRLVLPLARPSGTHHSIYLRSWRKDETNYRWYLYSDYCAQECTLQGLIEAHRATGPFTRRDDSSVSSNDSSVSSSDSSVSTEPDGSLDIPESAMWHFAECLASAAVAMKSLPGRSPARAKADSSKRCEIVHGDIKPDNLFLDLADPVRFAAYPTVKLGDFGSARYTHFADSENPDGLMQGIATEGYVAPEMCPIANSDGEPVQLERLDPPVVWDSKTNVWQIGRVLLSLAYLHTKEMAEAGQPVYDEDGYPDRWAPKPTCESYSEEMNNLINSCLLPLPEQRPTPEQLLNTIRVNGPINVQGMDTKRVVDLRHDNSNRLRVGASAFYRDGMLGYNGL